VTVTGFLPAADTAELVARQREAVERAELLERHAASLGAQLNHAMATIERLENELAGLRDERMVGIELREILNKDIRRWKRESIAHGHELFETYEIEAREREAFAAAMAAEEKHKEAEDEKRNG
jgi:hypothetical protein